jgi:hypothetical protein
VIDCQPAALPCWFFYVWATAYVVVGVAAAVWRFLYIEPWPRYRRAIKRAAGNLEVY